jgi:hypothetical protein
MAARPVWTAVEIGLTVLVFVGSVAVWVGLTYFFQQLSR